METISPQLIDPTRFLRRIAKYCAYIQIRIQFYAIWISIEGEDREVFLDRFGKAEEIMA